MGYIRESSNNASTISVSTLNFNKNLSSADTTIQHALDTIDDLTVSGSGATINDTTASSSTVYSSTKTTTLLGAKVDLVASATNGDIATLNASGNLVDSGKVISTDGTFASNVDTKIPTEKATKTYVDTKISNLVNSAPATLDTLKELADALGDDANFATTVTTNLGNKVDKTTNINGHTLSTNVMVSASDITTGTLPSAQLPIATASALGGVKAGANITIATDGTISSTASGGTSALTVNTVTSATYTASAQECILANDTSNSIAITLPAASTWSGQQIIIKKIKSTSNSITITPNGTETIDGSSSLSITNAYNSATLISDGSNIYII
jgi:hypothetical protein